MKNSHSFLLYTKTELEKDDIENLVEAYINRDDTEAHVDIDVDNLTERIWYEIETNGFEKINKSQLVDLIDYLADIELNIGVCDLREMLNTKSGKYVYHIQLGNNLSNDVYDEYLIDNLADIMHPVADVRSEEDFTI